MTCSSRCPVGSATAQTCAPTARKHPAYQISTLHLASLLDPSRALLFLPYHAIGYTLRVRSLPVAPFATLEVGFPALRLRLRTATTSTTLPRSHAASNCHLPPVVRRLTCAYHAVADCAHALRGVNATAGITRSTSLVTRFTSPRLRLALFATAPIRDSALHSNPPKDVHRLLSTTISPSLDCRLLASRTTVVDSAILRQHVAPGYPPIDIILRRLCASTALDAVYASHQEHSPCDLPRHSLWRPRLL